MMHTDPIADFFTRLRNAAAVRKLELAMPYSRNKEALAKLLVKNEVLAEVKTEGKGIDKVLLVKLPAVEGALFCNYKRVSKPGQRIYVRADKVHSVQQGFGLALISTSKGIMTDKEARKAKLGGELIAEIW